MTQDSFQIDCPFITLTHHQSVILTWKQTKALGFDTKLLESYSSTKLPIELAAVKEDNMVIHSN